MYLSSSLVAVFHKYPLPALPQRLLFIPLHVFLLDCPYNFFILSGSGDSLPRLVLPSSSIMAPIQRLAAATAVFLAGVSPAQALFQNGPTFTPCDSPVYCHGELLKQVELARPFADSKTFVDM